MAWFLSLPFLGPHVQAYHEGSVAVVVGMCPSWKAIFLELRQNQGNRQKFPSGFSVLAEVRGPGKGSGSRTPTCPSSQSDPLSV